MCLPPSMGAILSIFLTGLKCFITSWIFFRFSAFPCSYKHNYKKLHHRFYEKIEQNVSKNLLSEPGPSEDPGSAPAFPWRFLTIFYSENGPLRAFLDTILKPSFLIGFSVFTFPYFFHHISKKTLQNQCFFNVFLLNSQ